MKILFTGVSSFSGFWFIRELVDAGHDVICCLRQPRAHYAGIRKERVEQIVSLSQAHFESPFGSAVFLQTIPKCDLYCHHAADVTDYKSPDFDVAAALTNNTHHLQKVLQALQKKGCNQVLLTGSIFEQQEGDGEAVSPYGLSKGLTADVFAFYCKKFGINLAKFVIPNPFGPYEEPRFTSYLAKEWLSGRVPQVTTPDYVRDNIPISLLAKAYCHMAENWKMQKYNPSFYAETQGAFTARFAKELEGRLQIPCSFELCPQKVYTEPRVRINQDKLNPDDFKWNEKEFWNNLASYYMKLYNI